MGFFLKKNKKTIVFLFAFFGLAFLSANAVYAEGSAIASIAGGAVNSIAGGFLRLIFDFFGWLFALAGILFAYVVDPNSIIGIIKSPDVYTVWTSVRDFINMFFILVLLFSAFATVFQISKYNIRNLILNIIIMALLVNFSHTIARAIIDISNVIMYEFLNQMFEGNPKDLMAALGQNSGMTKLLMPEGKTSLTYMLFAIIFMFLLTISVLAISVILLVRVIVLAILVMLSPIGFVGYILPGKGSSFASKWWDNLIKYCFSGPILVFFLALSVRLMIAAKGYSSGITNITGANVNNQDQANYLASVAFMVSPIVMLWVGMGAAGSMGVAGASAASKWAKGTAQKYSGFNMGKRNWDDFKKERAKRVENEKSRGTKLAASLNNRQDRIVNNIGLTKSQRDKAQARHDKRIGEGNKDDIKKASEGHEATTMADLHRDISSMTPASVQAMNRDDAVKAAGMVKQALSRGTAYEKELEKNLKTLSFRHVGASGQSKPADPIPATIHAGMSPAQIAVAQANEKKMRDDMNKWLQEEKAAIMEQHRKIIQVAEDTTKIKPRTI